MASQQPSSSKEVYVGSYKRLESIGKGSFAVVYKGVHPDDNSLVAIKTVQHAQLKGKLKSNLFSEIDILKSIKHPHVVALINILESTNHIHLVMEFCQLGDLATFVRKRDKLAGHPVTSEMIRKYPNPPTMGFNEVVVRHFAKQLSAALEFLRSKNLVHRDLKPQNLLLNPPPSFLAHERPENRPYEVVKNSLIPVAGLDSLPALKIADFGFARHLPSTTLAETLCGSPLYMAPEILRYERYDAKADLWSVGTVLYELMVGKPPFRAANHVDLLRKIEKTADKIKFPDELAISDDMRDIILGLLKKMPTERMSWERFFQSNVITKDIPGLVAADLPKSKPIPTSPPQAEVRDKYDEPFPGSNRPSPPDEPVSTQTKVRARADSTRGTATPPASLTRESPTPKAKRPGLNTHATAPSAPQVQRERPLAGIDMERRRSSLNATNTAADQAARDRQTQDKAEEEKAAQDVAFERDYVVVEKRAVEVNAFADELAASPHLQAGTRASPNAQPGAIVRRATTQAVSGSAPGSQTPGRQMQVAVRPDALHHRKSSYERKYGQSRTSATSALAAALNMVNFRLYGSPLAPGRGPSPPQGYSAFPSYPVTQNTPLLLGDSSKPLALDEDQKVLGTIEECATRSDVVFGFAEVKLKQLIPISPSNDNALGIRQSGASDDGATDSAGDDDGLTVDAIVGISEEALVLYVKALSILTNAINLAGKWFNHRYRGEIVGDISSSPRTVDAGKASPTAVGIRVNQVVQWARTRYNECLEKSEYIGRRLVQAQKKLPRSHPGHPSNHRTPEPFEANDLISSINLSSGITAEKLMYDRALDMSRGAAVNELVGEDLSGCEVSYITAIRLLEAVLEKDEELGSKRGADSKKEKGKVKEERSSSDALDSIDDADRETVFKLIEEMRVRLKTLRKKIPLRQASRQNSIKSQQPLAQEMVRTNSKSPKLQPVRMPTISRTPPK